LTSVPVAIQEKLGTSNDGEAIIMMVKVLLFEGGGGSRVDHPI
jgi:hypothetical protein